MQIRRRYAAVMAGFGALVMGTTLQSGAATPTAREDSLLGVRLLSSYKTILQRFGQPAEIQVGMPAGNEEGAGNAQAGAMPGMGGGPVGMPGVGMPGSGGFPGAPMGMPGAVARWECPAAFPAAAARPFPVSVARWDRPKVCPAAAACLAVAAWSECPVSECPAVGAA